MPPRVSVHPIPGRQVVRFSYFMIRVRQGDDEAPRDDGQLRGIVARLGTSERHDFESAEELLHLVTTWAGTLTNVQPESEPRNRAWPDE